MRKIMVLVGVVLIASALSGLAGGVVYYGAGASDGFLLYTNESDALEGLYLRFDAPVTVSDALIVGGGMPGEAEDLGGAAVWYIPGEVVKGGTFQVAFDSVGGGAVELLEYSLGTPIELVITNIATTATGVTVTVTNNTGLAQNTVSVAFVGGVVVDLTTSQAGAGLLFSDTLSFSTLGNSMWVLSVPVGSVIPYQGAVQIDVSAGAGEQANALNFFEAKFLTRDLQAISSQLAP